MRVHTTIAAFRAELDAARHNGAVIGFVPTMGALHAGHMSLVEHSRRNGAAVAVSIFVNPLQFGANEDLSKYPRPLERDLELCAAAGVSDVFAPGVEEMYPNGSLATSIHVSGVTEMLEGEHRPGHFDGVATVVAKLFSIVGKCHAYFGEKDWQQLQVIRQLVADLSLPTFVVGCPTVREQSGLALSSRNVYLSEEERIVALSIANALQSARLAFDAGTTHIGDLESLMRDVLSTGGVTEIGYAAVRNASLQVPLQADETCRMLVSARIGNTRLIDNMGFV